MTYFIATNRRYEKKSTRPTKVYEVHKGYTFGTRKVKIAECHGSLRLLRMCADSNIVLAIQHEPDYTCLRQGSIVSCATATGEDITSEFITPASNSRQATV